MNEKPQGERWCSLPHDPWCPQCKRELARLRRIEEAARNYQAKRQESYEYRSAGPTPDLETHHRLANEASAFYDELTAALAEQEPTE